MNHTNNQKYIFSKLPSVTILAQENSKEQFKKQVEKIYNKENEEDLKQIANFIYYKLLITNYKELSWTKEEYKEFKRLLNKTDSKELEIIASSIKKCLLTPNSKIYEELVSFSKHVDWYPSKEKILDKTTNKYLYIDKKIEVLDCYYVISNLVSHIYQYICHYAINLVQEHQEETDINNIVNNTVKEKFLIDFEANFKFIKEYSLFSEVYEKISENSLKRLIQNIYFTRNSMELRKNKTSSFCVDKSAKVQRRSLRMYSRGYNRK